MAGAIQRKKTLKPFLVNRNSAESSSKQIARKLGKMILDGQLAAKTKLPDHASLAAMLGVSANTIQNAMEQLVRRGLVSRRRGLGTFVAAVPKGAKGKLGLVFYHQPDTQADHEWGRPSAEWGYFRAALEQSISLKLQLVVDSWEHLEREETGQDLGAQFGSDGGMAFDTSLRDNWGQGAKKIQMLALNAMSSEKRARLYLASDDPFVIPSGMDSSHFQFKYEANSSTPDIENAAEGWDNAGAAGSVDGGIFSFTAQPGGEIIVSDSLDNAGDFHVFRILWDDEAELVQVWRDDVQIGVDLLSADAEGFNRLISFGNASGLNSFGQGEIDYFRWDATGAWAPIPEPATLALIAIGGLAMLHKRRYKS